MRTLISIICLLTGSLTGAATPAAGQTECDSLYSLLQNLAVGHIRANEVWVEHFIDCPPTEGIHGGFILSELDQEGKKDRAIIAVYNGRAGWLYKFGERAPNIRFLQPSPLVDVDGDGESDFVFLTTDDTAATERSYHIALAQNGTKRSNKVLNFPKGLAIDSLLPAPEGQACPLQVIDRRAREIGGLDANTAPVSYRYLEWDATLDPPGYSNLTTDYLRLYPMMAKRAEFVDALPDTGLLEYDTVEGYEEFLVNIIGYCLDQSNLDREADGFIEVRGIMDRTRYKGSTQVLEAPRTVTDQLRRALPKTRKIPRKRK